MEKKRIIFFIVVVLTALSILFLPGFSELHKLREDNDQLKRRIVLLEEHNDNLKEEMLKMKQDPDYVEKKARKKLGIVKKGEIIYKTDQGGE
ncbi:MAG: septum formation initiator family protein [Candidatus Omnitrophota bacterium]|jgi:cell division protein FtsB